MKEATRIESHTQDTSPAWSITRAALLEGLKTVSGVVESSQILHILSHVQLIAHDDHLQLVTSDSEVELWANASLTQPISTPCKLAVSCRKLMDVCRTLPQDACLDFKVSKGWLTIRSGKTQFKLATLSADQFPLLPDLDTADSVTLSEDLLRKGLQKTHFSMAHQDVRFFLNGLFLQIRSGQMILTATDGHRLARFEMPLESASELEGLIVPRKAVLELLRLMKERNSAVQLLISKHHMRVETQEMTLITNLLEGQYPPCDRLLDTPDHFNIASVHCYDFKQVLSRAAVLSHEKFKGARLNFQTNLLEVSADNADKECAEDGLRIAYEGPELKLAFNVHYLLEVLTVVECEHLSLHLTDGEHSSVLITEPSDEGLTYHSRYLIMPLTL